MRVRLWLPSLALLALGACATDDSGKLATTPAPLTPTEHFAIAVKPAPEELRLAAHDQGLSATQAEALRYLVGRWSDADGGAITIKAPTHGPDPAGAYRTANDARDYLISQGVGASDIHIVGYDVDGDAPAPILIGFMRYEAKGPQCGDNWENLATTHANEQYSEFGCAVTANMAAQIADPADLLHPRAEDPPDAGRRATVLGQYRKGANTSSQKDTQADGTISDAVQ